MRYRLFQYPLPAPPELEDLNAFLQAQRVATVTQHLAQSPEGAMLVFVVQTVPSSNARGPAPGLPRVDYRELLNSAQFAVFSRLREERKKWAESEGVPVYTIFTNAQLAEMVKRGVRTAQQLGGIEGIGTARIEKYAARLLPILADLPPEGGESTATP